MNTARWWAIVLSLILVTPGALAQDQRQVDEGSVTLVSDPFGPWEGYVNGSSTMSMEHLRWWIEDGNAVLIHPLSISLPWSLWLTVGIGSSI